MFKFFNHKRKYTLLIFLGFILFLGGLALLYMSSSEGLYTLARLLIFLGIFLSLGHPLSKLLEDGERDSTQKRVNDERNKTITRLAAYKTIQVVFPTILILVWVFIDNWQLTIVLLFILMFLTINLFGWRSYFKKHM